MLLNFLILLTVVGFVLMILSFYWESLAFSSITFVIWMGLSISIYQIEIPYQAITDENVIITGTHTIENLYMYSMFYIALAIIMFLYLITLVFRLYQGYEKRIM
jgi:hypothetical protein